MSDPIFPLVFANDEIRLLTAIVLGFLFGFSLERGGFGNARKLAGQFYLYDMTVFKVMFTAILVAMTGLYALVGIGWVDLSRMWINPTFMGAQVVGGLLLGVGFIMSGLCPGTSVVSAASGRWDGVVTLAGIFVGTLVFTLALDGVPALETLYVSGSMGVSVLPDLLALPALPFTLGIVLLAGAALVGAEAVERAFRRRREPVELSAPGVPVAKFAVVGVLVLVLVGGLGLRPPDRVPPALRPLATEPVAPLALARRLIDGDPDLLVLDLRPDATDRIPGAYPAAPDSSALPLLAAAGPATEVVLVTAGDALNGIPASWPDRLRYRLLAGGGAGWAAQVLTPMAPADGTAEELARVRMQNALAAYFGGAGTAAPVVVAPPPIPSAAAGSKPKRGGC